MQPIPVLSNTLQAMLLGLFITTSVACAQADDPPPAATGSLTFGGVTYVHRWSQGGQHEFTPEAEEDLDTWIDMVTINVLESVSDGEQLAATANGVLANYQGAGEIMRTDSKPRTETAPAEHFIAAILGSPAFLEAAFARLMLIEDKGVVVVYSHRLYGQSVGQAMSDWVSKEGQRVEETLMNWRDVPSIIKTLPVGD